MLDRIVDAIGMLFLGKQYAQGIVYDCTGANSRFVLDTIFPNEKMQASAYKGIEKLTSKQNRI